MDCSPWAAGLFYLFILFIFHTQTYSSSDDTQDRITVCLSSEIKLKELLTPPAPSLPYTCTQTHIEVTPRFTFMDDIA